MCPDCNKPLTANTDGDWRAPSVCLECVQPAVSTLCVATHLGYNSVGTLVTEFCQHRPKLITHRRDAFPGQPRDFTEMHAGGQHAVKLLPAYPYMLGGWVALQRRLSDPEVAAGTNQLFDLKN